MCVTQLDSKLLERGLAATPGSVVTMTSAIAALKRIKYFKQPILNRTKFHGTCYIAATAPSQLIAETRRVRLQ
jgi:selenocysteine-specific elongation factor